MPANGEDNRHHLSSSDRPNQVDQTQDTQKTIPASHSDFADDSPLNPLRSPLGVARSEHTQVAGLPEIPGYVVHEVLGIGGMGTVYRSTDIGLGRTVAIKVMNVSEIDHDRFRTEARILASLDHQNVVRVFAVEAAAASPYFSMEYVEGGTLGDRLRAGPIGHPAGTIIVEAISRAVDYVHQHGLVHRDIKPSNVLLTADGVPKLTDFGVAKRLETQGDTVTGMALGTPSYMSPEQLTDSKSAGPATDVWALGVILYEVLTGVHPFRRADIHSTYQQILFCDPPLPSRAGAVARADIDSVCMRCLRKHPNDRYPSAAALASDLVAVLACDRAPFCRRARLWLQQVGRRRRTLTALALTSGGLLGSLLYTGFRRPEGHTDQPATANVAAPPPLVQPESPVVEMQTVLVAEQYLNTGERFEDIAVITLKDVPKSQQVGKALHSIEQVIGHRLNAPVPKGRIITWDDLIKTDLLPLPRWAKLHVVTASNKSDLTPFIRPGALINVIVTPADKPSRVVARELKAFAVSEVMAGEKAGAMQITVAVTDQTALAIREAEQSGQLSFGVNLNAEK